MNKNAVPFDDAKPTVTSGIRVGSAACTSRGMGTDAFNKIGDMILAVLGDMRAGTFDHRTQAAIRAGVTDLARRFPLPY
ncbi:Serine hydroxymethyltransferase 2 [compost metagenome]